MDVKRQITIRRLLAVFMIAGLVLAPLSRPVMAGTTSDASTSAMAHDMSMSATADEMAANDIPCCAAVIDCDKCVLMAACMTKCFAGMSTAIFHPLLAVSTRIAPLWNDSWPDSLGHLPPDHPPRI